MLLIADYPDYAIACTHLSLTPADALESAAIICREARARAPRPMVVMGDLNSLPLSQVVDSLRAVFEIVSAPRPPTFPADTPAPVYRLHHGFPGRRRGPSAPQGRRGGGRGGGI